MSGRDPGRRPASPAPERLHSLYAATRELLTARTRSALCEAVLATTETVLSLPVAAVYIHEEERLVPTATTDVASGDAASAGRTPTETDRFDAYESTHPVWRGFVDGETVWVSEADGWEPTAPVDVAVPVGEHGTLLAGRVAGERADETTVELSRLLCANAAAALDRLERERRLDRLHETARELMTAGDTATVAATATDAAHEVLGLTANGVFLAASEEDRLVPVGVTAEAREAVGAEVPELDSGSVAWDVYVDGEPELHDDVRRDERVTDPQTPIRSMLVLPLGDHGVFVAASTTVGAFDEADLSLARVFAANVEAALDAADRQARLRRRESELARQNERLEEFASVVSHDLRNPLNVATGQVELAAAAAETESATDRLDAALEAHEQMETLIDDLLSLARHGRSVGETEPTEVAVLARREWPDTADAALTVADGIGTVSADPSRLRELLGNLLRNALDHAGDGVHVEVGPLQSGGFYVADDGPGIDPGDREQVFERGFTTAAEGTGYGLAIVADVAAAHGWTVEVTDSESGGARFEVRTDPELE
ncbi:sensor histidine kinase [Halobaculum sp. MBLA0147]|uniref:sensor histidine kinase n=1 Tax=Halobaculum sp. MBLA0147 TaxID=3079934 RepID=UPI00352600A9